ncbi:MAG TPA: TadE/TadG family type IV pilus assembly protein [Patescibacteria group bacterium]|nr:TadE/TadG family type IV pilus assembly protein [Patescibacteria group bacterium]
MRAAKRMRIGRRERGGQLVELALVLPILLVLVAGVADFAQAWNARQVLANAARDGARLGGNQLKADLTNNNPTTIQDLCQQVAEYLIGEKINPAFMGISGTTSSTVSTGCSSPGTVADSSGSTAPAEAYTYYESGTSYGLKIEPNVSVGPSGGACGAGETCVSSTIVTLTYPYSWSFGFDHVIRLFSGSSGYASTIPIQVYSTMPNIAQY